MKRAVKIILSVISWVIISLVALPIALGLLLQVGAVQNFAVGKLTAWLTEQTGTTFSIRRVDVGFFNRAAFEGVYVQDPVSRDTMLYVDNLKADITGINFFTGKISLGTVSLTNGEVYLAKDSTGVLNVKLVTDTFKSKQPKERGDFRLNARELNLIDFKFGYRVYKPKEQQFGVNFQDLGLESIYFQARGIEVLNDDIRFRIDHMNFIERSGFTLAHLSCERTVVSSRGLRFGDLQLETGASLLRFEHLDFLYDRWQAYLDFVHDVTIDALIKPSIVSYKTISQFTKHPSSMPTTIQLSGSVGGPVCDLRGSIPNLAVGQTTLETAFHISGLPDVGTTRFDVTVANLLTDANDVLSIYKDVTGKELENIRPILSRSSTIHFSGGFDGLIKEFNAHGRLAMSQGTIEADLKLYSSDVKATRMVGNVSTNGFNAGSLLNAPQLGAVGLRAGIDAVIRNGELQLGTNAEISELEFKGYRYNNIKMNGRFEGKTFNGTLSSSDPNLTFGADGRLDLEGSVPAYDVELDITRADLFALNLNRRDSVSVLSGAFSLHATGTTLDDMNGNDTIHRLEYINHMDTVHAGRIVFEARNSEISKSLTMTSDFADIELRGSNSYSNIFSFLGQSLKRYMPSIPELEEVGLGDNKKKSSKTASKLTLPMAKIAKDIVRDPSEKPVNNGYYMLKVNVKQANNVAAIFIPGLEVAQGSQMTFLLNPYIDQFSLSVKSDYILRRDMYIENLMIESRNQADSVSIYAGADLFGIGSFEMPNFSIIGGIKDNRISLGTRFSNPETGFEALLSTASTIRRAPNGMPQLDVEFYPTTFTADHQTWYLAGSHIVVDTTGLDFDQFRIWANDESLSINGKGSSSTADTLRLNIRNLNLSPLSKLVSKLGYTFAGRLGGDATLVAPLGEIQFTADMLFDSLALNQHQFGRVAFHSEWDRPRKWVKFAVSEPGGTEPVKGVFDSKSKKYRADFNFPAFDMNLLEPLMQGIMSDTKGSADVRLILTGAGGAPSLNGTVDVKDYNATVDFTRARYSLSGPVTVKNNRFELPPVPVSDGINGQGTISAWFDSEYFKKLSYGVHVDFTDMLCLNTTLQDNPIFYGHVFGTGSFDVGGDDRHTKIGVRAETAGNSTFILPISQVSTIAEADFITFVDHNKPQTESRITRFRRERTKARVKTKSELTVDLNMTVLPNTEARIVMNERFGDEIKGRGNGRFRMNIVPNRQIFTMDGQYDVTEGTYMFTILGAVANKLFTIQPGSTLFWTGDPADPHVNLNASYKVRTSLAPLEGQNQMGNRSGTVAVNCGINLTGQLFSPTIRLNITAPSATPETQNLLRNLLNTEEANTTQFIYLMALGGFMPDANSAGAIGTMSGSLAGIAGMEFISNQISNLISGDKYNLRVGYRPQSEMSSEEVTFDVSANIIDNLSVEVGGNYDVNRNSATNISNNPLSLDAYLTWVLNKSGSLKVKGFTRTIDRFDESQGLQDNGVGIYYRQEFQNMRDLKARYRAWMEQIRLKSGKRQERRREQRQEKAADRVQD